MGKSSPALLGSAISKIASFQWFAAVKLTEVYVSCLNYSIIGRELIIWLAYVEIDHSMEYSRFPIIHHTKK